jgi:hypothetical protein
MKTLDCPKTEQLIVGELDEGLDAATLQALENHLRECPSCRAFRKDTARILASVAADVPEDPGELYWKHYETSLGAKLSEKSPVSRSGYGWKAAAAFAALAAVLTTSQVLNFRSQSPGQMDQTAALSLMRDLSVIYGPGLEDVPVGAEPGDDLREALAAGGQAPEDYLLSWFEVEDESNRLLL